MKYPTEDLPRTTWPDIPNVEEASVLFADLADVAWKKTNQLYQTAKTTPEKTRQALRERLFDEREFRLFVKQAQRRCWIEDVEYNAIMASLEHHGVQSALRILLTLESVNLALRFEPFLLTHADQLIGSDSTTVNHLLAYLLTYPAMWAWKCPSAYLLAKDHYKHPKALAATEMVPLVGWTAPALFVANDHPEFVQAFTTYFKCRRQFRKVLRGQQSWETLGERFEQKHQPSTALKLAQLVTQKIEKITG